MELFFLAGMLAPLWMLLGVILIARRYPGYSHTHQVMSELGALGRPTQFIHPLVNNYPIGLLFIAFGIGLTLLPGNSVAAGVVSILMIMHGVSHLLTGYFPCDEDLGLESPSYSQVIHNAAGLVMYFSLLAGAILCAVQPLIPSNTFAVYSGISAIISAIFLVLMIRALGSGYRLGLYQRLSYGILVAWCAVLGFYLIASYPY